jgi:hypothetical protein
MPAPVAFQEISGHIANMIVDRKLRAMSLIAFNSKAH